MKRTQLSELLVAGMSNRNWTVRDLAEKAQVAYETARSAVRGLSSPSVENAEKLLNAVDQSLTAIPLPEADASAPAPAEEVPA